MNTQNYLHALVRKKDDQLWIVILISVLFSMLIAWIVRLNYNTFTIVDISQMDRNSPQIQYYIDGVELVDGYLSIYGWAMHGEPITSVNCSVALRALSDSSVWRVKTGMVSRGDLPEVFGISGLEKGGFRSYVDVGKLDEDDVYQLCLLYGNNEMNTFVDTGIQVNTEGRVAND